jgi:hypothetical protein
LYVLAVEMQTRILLVEDNEDFREAFAQMLELELAPELDVAFAHADSLAEAHALLREEDGLDAALIDIGLPDGDGLDLVRELEGGRLGQRLAPHARDNGEPGALRGHPGGGGGREGGALQDGLGKGDGRDGTVAGR